MPIQGLDHINIHTSKREETLRFYTEMLDFQEGFRPPFDFPGAWLYAGERAVIHLVVREGVPGGIENPVDHVAFEAQGFEQTCNQLDAVGYPYKTADVPETKIRQMFLVDPNGVKLELNFSEN